MHGSSATQRPIYYLTVTARTGVYAAPLGIIQYDDLGNATGSEVSGWVNRFWIPFTRKTVESAIAEHGGHYKNLVLGEAREAWR